MQGVHTVLAPPPARSKRVETRSPVGRVQIPPPPRALVWLSGLVVVAGVVMAVIGALRSGPTWDEPYHVMRLRNYLDQGWFALDWAFGGGGAAGAETNTVVYAPVTMLLLHLLCAIVGVEGWDTVSSTPAAYDVRHLGVLLIGLVGTWAAATITRILLGSWRWALVTAAALLALPMWTGHLMFNIKDVPVATGYTLVTLAAVTMVAPVRGQRLLRIGALAGGAVLMVGTRPAMWVAVVAAIAVLLAGTRIAGRFGNARTALAEVAAGVGAAAVVLLLVYPEVFAHPASLLHSAEQSSSFRGGTEASYGYVPFFVTAQVPLLMLALTVIGTVSAIGFLRREWRTETSQATRVTLVLLQMLALPLLAVVRHSDLYNGLRQLLFAFPAWAIVVTLGLARLLAWGRERRRGRVAAGLALVALAVPLIDQATLFPYQYTYYNVALDATGVQVPSDYWRASAPELMDRIPTDGQIVCGPTRTGPEDDARNMTAGRYSSDSSVDCRRDPLGPLAPEWTTRDLPARNTLPHWEFYALIDRDHPLPRNCTRVAEVNRTRHGREVRMTYLARCRQDPSPLGPDPISFVRLPAERNMFPYLWAYAPEGWVMRHSGRAIDATGSTASLTFDAPNQCARRACELVVETFAPADLVTTVNDDRADVSTRPGSIAVRLPPGTDDTWVTFTRATGRSLDLRVRSIRVRSMEENR